MDEYEQNFFQSSMKKLNISKIEIISQSRANKGDGYMGNIKFLKIKDNLDQKEYHFVLKRAHENEHIRKQTPIRNAYVREIFMYNTIFPEFVKFQIDQNILSPFTGFAKYYNSSIDEGYEMLLIEDLKQKQLKLWNRKVPMDEKHVEIVILEYARFHSVSLALRSLHPERFKTLTNSLVSIFQNSTRREIFGNIMTSKFQRAYNVLASHKDAIIALQKFEKEATKFVFEDIRNEEDYLVITHGDCWCNNMMFKYEDKEDVQKPTSVCFLDWQTSKMGCPVLDLSYFLYICSSKSVINNFRYYLKLYHTTISNNLQSIGCDPDKIFPFSLLENYWKKYSKFGLYMCFINLELALNEAEDVPDLNEMAAKGANILKNLNIGQKSKSVAEEYDRRIKDLIIVMTENKLL